MGNKQPCYVNIENSSGVPVHVFSYNGGDEHRDEPYATYDIPPGATQKVEAAKHPNGVQIMMRMIKLDGQDDSDGGGGSGGGVASAAWYSYGPLWLENEESFNTTTLKIAAGEPTPCLGRDEVQQALSY